jgi:hypothetical protein
MKKQGPGVNWPVAMHLVKVALDSGTSPKLIQVSRKKQKNIATSVRLRLFLKILLEIDSVGCNLLRLFVICTNVSGIRLVTLLNSDRTKPENLRQTECIFHRTLIAKGLKLRAQ